MRLSDDTLEWLIETRYAVDRAIAPTGPDKETAKFSKCGTSDWLNQELYEQHPAVIAASRAFALAGFPDDWMRVGRRGPLLKKEHEVRHPHRYFVGIPTRAYYATCHVLQGLQPLYLIPKTPANAARIAAQTLLICSLYQLAAWLGEVPYGNVGKVRKERRDGWSLSTQLLAPPKPFSEPRHPEFAAYLLRELELAKKVGILPLATSEHCNYGKGQPL